MVSTMTSVETMKIPEGYKQTEVGVIPEDWAVQTIFNLTLDMLQGVNTAIDVPEYVEGGVPMLKANNVIDQTVKFQGCDTISRATYDGYSNRYKLEKNDFLFSNIGARLGTGSLLESDIECSFAWNVMRIVPDLNKVVPHYLAFQVNSPKNSEKIKSEQSGSGMGFIPKATMQKIQLAVPALLKEQTAIANALSDVDNLIASLETLIAKKSAIKTAAMQQLLTGKKRLPAFVKESEKQGAKQNSELDNTSKTAQVAQTKQTSTLNSDLHKESGEGLDLKSTQHSEVGNANNKKTAPRPGYKQSELGEIPEDWEVKPLGASLSIMHGKDQKQVEFSDGKYPILGTGGEMGRTDSYLYNKPSVLIGRKGSINKPRYMDSPFWTVDTLFYSQVSDKFNAKFIYYKFCMIDWMSYNEASGVPSLNSSTIESVVQVFPQTKEEQTAIANVLSDMDTELDALQQRLSKTQKIKQGMMQELLTGKTRLV